MTARHVWNACVTRHLCMVDMYGYGVYGMNI